MRGEGEKGDWGCTIYDLRVTIWDFTLSPSVMIYEFGIYYLGLWNLEKPETRNISLTPNPQIPNPNPYLTSFNVCYYIISILLRKQLKAI